MYPHMVDHHMNQKEIFELFKNKTKVGKGAKAWGIECVGTPLYHWEGYEFFTSWCGRVFL